MRTADINKVTVKYSYENGVTDEFIKPIINKTIPNVKIKNEDVANALGGLPPIKMHCSVLAEDAIKAAIADYKRKAGQSELMEKFIEVSRLHEEKELLSRNE